MWHLCSCDAVVLSYLHRGLYLFFSSGNIVSAELLPLLRSCGTANKNQQKHICIILYYISTIKHLSQHTKYICNINYFTKYYFKIVLSQNTINIFLFFISNVHISDLYTHNCLYYLLFLLFCTLPICILFFIICVLSCCCYSVALESFCPYNKFLIFVNIPGQ